MPRFRITDIARNMGNYVSFILIAPEPNLIRR